MYSNAAWVVIFIFILVIGVAIFLARRPRRWRGGGAVRSKYAYVSVMFGGDAYLPGVLAWARSLARTNTRYDIVCMVTNDVPAAARGAMAGAGIRVVDVPYAAGPPAAGRGRAAWNVMDMVEYEKVLYMDADTTVLANIDDLFALAAPAAPWPHGRLDAGIVLVAPGAGAGAAAHMPDDIVLYWFHDDMFGAGKKKRIIHHIGMPKPWQMDAARFPDTRAWAAAAGAAL